MPLNEQTEMLRVALEPSTAPTTPYLDRMEGTITFPDGTLIGRFALTHIHVSSAWWNEVPLASFLSSDYELNAIRKALFTSKDTLKRSVRALVEPPWFGDVVAIDFLGILPAYRGQRRGLLALHEIMRTIVDPIHPFLSLVHPAPFVYNQDQDWNVKQCPANDFVGHYVLCQYYAQFGFEALGGTSFMIRDSALLLPSQHQLRHALIISNAERENLMFAPFFAGL